MAHEGACLEQVGAAAAAVRHAEAGAAAGQRKARDGVWREEIIRAGGHAEDAAGAWCWIRASYCRRWFGSRRSRPPTHSSARQRARPPAPCCRQQRKPRARSWCAACRMRHRHSRWNPLRHKRAHSCHHRAAGAERVGHDAHELGHGLERGLLRCRRGLAGGLGQAARRERAVDDRNAAIAVEVADDGVADGVLIAAQAAARRRDEAQHQIEVGVGGVVAQRRMDIRRQVGLGHRGEGAADAGRGQDGVLLHDVAAVGIDRLDRRSTQCRRARHIGESSTSPD